MKPVRLALAAALLSPLIAPAQTSVSDRSAELHKVFADYWEQHLRNSPEEATSVGDKRFNDRWSDFSPAEVNRELEQGREFIARLGAISTDGLSDADRVSEQLLLRALIDTQEGARFKAWQMPMDQFNGPHTGAAIIVGLTPFDDANDYAMYLKRLHALPAAFTQVQENMSLGTAEGRTPPRFLMEKALTQVQTFAAMKPEDSPFAQPLKHFPASVTAEQQKQIRADVLKAIETEVLPAYARLARFVEKDYIPRARTEPGVSALPDGDAFYAFLVRQSTTTTRTPDEIHKIGLAEVARDEAEMLVIAKKLGATNLKSFNASLKSNPKLHAKSADELVAAYKGHIDEMRGRLPELFHVLPKAPLEVVRVPAYQEKAQAAAYYEGGTPDGKRPGQVFVNTYNFAERGLESVETVAYHEGLPGHHLQISIAQEQTGVPEFRKHSYYTAYTEGWGLYSERLGKDVGFYKDPYSDYGRLEADIWRAIRLVVDTGVHSKHWTRQQMVDFFHDHSAIDETNVQAEVDRYIAWPAQALGYKVGQLKFLELRERAQTKLGTRFKLSDFHDLVIDAGALPLDVLEQRVDTWIAHGGGRPS